jgi:hypothetical protein
LQQLDPAVVCCFMTGDAGHYTEAELMRHGGWRFFAKPFALAELCAFLGHLAMPEPYCRV